MTQDSETLHWNGNEYRIRLTGQKAIGIFEGLEKAGHGPPRHRHMAEDETFHILSGEAEFFLDGELFTRGPGDVIFVARGREHTFRPLGETPLRMFTVMTPGGFEGFFREMAEGGFVIPDDMEQIAGIAARYNLEFTGPPLGHEQAAGH